MRYTVTTFKVRQLDADKEHFLLLALNNKNRINGCKVNLDGNTDRDADSAGRRLRCGA